MDNIVRGVKTADPGIMTASMITLMDWAEEKLDRAKLTCAFEDNTHAIAFYEDRSFS